MIAGAKYFRYYKRRHSAFTLTELLVVIGIIAVILALLMPGIAAAWRQAQGIQCASNVRQLVIAMSNYAASFRGKYPPNTSWTDSYWIDEQRIGKFVGGGITYGFKEQVGPPYTCPRDPGAIRSYAMNLWASSKSDVNANDLPLRGTYFDSTARPASQLILITETWSYAGSEGLYRALFTIGWSFPKPGDRFGLNNGLLVNCGRWGQQNTQLAFVNHAERNSRHNVSRGRVNIGYLDGHVAMKADVELADPVTGRSRLDSWWSPLDVHIND